MASLLRLYILLCCLSATNVSAGYVAQLHGSGTTNPSKFFWKVMQMMQARAKKPVRLTYRAVGSTTGQKEFSQSQEGTYDAPLSDFGAGDIAMSKDRYDNITATGSREMVHVPFALGAIGVFHSVPVGEVGVHGVRLSPCVVAKILSGQIQTWDHPDIKAINALMNVPANTPIKVARRTEGSSSTAGLTEYLHSKVPECLGDLQPGASDNGWPTQTNFVPVQGSGGMTDYLQNEKYAIGYLDAGHGHHRGLQEIKLRNEDGTFLTSLEAMNAVDEAGNNGISEAVAIAAAKGRFSAALTEDWSGVNVYSMEGTYTWPIVLISYLYLPKDARSFEEEKEALLKGFVDTILGDEAQELMRDFYFHPLPSLLQNKAKEYRNVMQWANIVPEYELFDSTEAWRGMSDTAITTKRDSYSLWKLGELEVAVSAMQQRVFSLENDLVDRGIVPLHGSGTTNPKNWFAKVMKLMAQGARANLHLTYRAVGSSTGQAEFLGDETNNYSSYNAFGAGDIPMSSDQWRMLNHMVHIPFALGAIGVFHSVPANMSGGQDVRLDACLLAKIFSGEIDTWDHVQIKAQNPGLNVPAGTKIRVVHRTKGSSSTSGLTGYLHTACPFFWNSAQVGAQITWPTASNFIGVEGSPGMQTELSDNSYSIGYLDAGHGHDLELREIALTNKDGQSRTSKESLALGGVSEAGKEGVKANVFARDPRSDWADVNLYDMPGSITWPIVLVSYLYVRVDQTQTNLKQCSALKAFIESLVENWWDLCEEFGFSLPDTTLRGVAEVAASMVVYPPAMQEIQLEFEDSTMAGVGMGPYIISAKRHPYTITRDEILQEQARILKLKVGDLSVSAEVNRLKLEVEHLEEKQVREDSMKAVTEYIAIAAVAMAVLSMIPGCCACLILRRRSKEAQQPRLTYEWRGGE